MPALPEPNVAEYWVDRAFKENLNVRIAESNFEIAKLEVDRARARPLSDGRSRRQLHGAGRERGSVVRHVGSDSRTGIIGLQLNVPIYQGGFIDSRVREAIALQEKSRQDLEAARRAALFAAQTGFAGVTSATASVKAFEQAVVSAESALASNIVGQEVGVRTFLDVLNVQQNVYSTRRDLADAYFKYLIGAAAAQGFGRRVVRPGRRGSQSPAQGLTARARRGFPLAAMAASMRGASHAMSRSAAPRCAAWNASAASRIARRRGASSKSAATVAIERRGIRDFDRGAGRQRLLGGVGEVEHVRTDERRPSQADRLDQVLPAERKQAAADERDVRGREVAGHFAHRVAEHDFDVGGHGRVAAAAHERHRALAQEIGDGRESLRMARDDDGERARRQAARGERIEDHRLLAVARGCGDPRGPRFAEAHLELASQGLPVGSSRRRRISDCR